MNDPCDLQTDEEPTQSLYINHSLWWAWAAVMWMGCEVAPKALSTRFIAGMWYLFTLIMVSSYTANLAASLTAENLHTPIQSAEDLVNQNVIKYGCLGGGSTHNFFKVLIFIKVVNCLDIAIVVCRTWYIQGNGRVHGTQ